MQKLAELCIRRPVFATMLITALVVMGAFSFSGLGVDLFPRIDFPTTTVTTVLVGASPEEVETTVTQKIEEAVNTISGIDEMRSVSAEGISQVFVTFTLDKDPDVAAQEVRDKVNGILRDLPEDIEPPVVEKFDTDASPIMAIAISSPRDPRETTKIVKDEIKENLETVAGVGQVRFIGERVRQIQVLLDPQRMAAYNVTVDQIAAALRAQNVEIPGGRIDEGRRELTLRTMGRITRSSDFGEIIVASVNGSPVKVRDFATVEDSAEESRTLARLDGGPAIVLEIRKQSGTNTVQVIDGIKARLNELRQTLPGDFRLELVRDQSDFIVASFHAVLEHLILGGIFAAAVVMLFIRNWRATLIAGVAIPASIISTFLLMNVMDFTLNQITMLALTLVVGIVIDDAIVVLENIFRFQEEKKLDPVTAAIEATRDIGLAVLATTLSLIIIFLPVAFMGGIVGRFMSSFGYTAAFAIGVSLLVSFTLTPMLSARYLKIDHSNHGGSGTKEKGFFKLLSNGYGRMLLWSVGHRKTIIAISVAVVLSTIPLFMLLGMDFLPQDDQSEFEITVRAPVGSALQGTDQVMRQIEAEVRQLPEIQNLLTTIGADGQTRVERGAILVKLKPLKERKYNQQDIMAMARERLVKFRELKISIQPPAAISGGGFANVDIQYFVQGPDLDKLTEYATRISDELRKTPGVADVDTTFEPGKPEIRANINREKASDLGANVASIASALRILVGGEDQVTTYREGKDRYDVLLRVQKQFRNSPEVLNQLYVPSSTIGNLALSNVVHLDQGSGPSQIDHYNRQRQITILANVLRGQSQSEVIARINQIVAQLEIPPTYRVGLIGRSRELGRSAYYFVLAFVLSFAFMYMVLAAQFESFIDPITILVSLPLAVPFALLSLLLARENYSVIYSSLGILMLFGIVKKNAILQVDHIKRLRASGVERADAIYHGCQDRLRPILMTTAALVAGMIPLALGTGPGAGSRRTVAVVVIGGQTLCLLLTLLVTPVVYSVFDDLATSPAWGRTQSWLSAQALRARRGVTSRFRKPFPSTEGD